MNLNLLRGCTYVIINIIYITNTAFTIFIRYVTVSRLMGSTAASAANMGHHMGACAVPDSKPMQFPLAQRRKRRVLFTQAQVSTFQTPPSIGVRPP